MLQVKLGKAPVNHAVPVTGLSSVDFVGDTPAIFSAGLGCLGDCNGTLPCPPA